eukprot:7068304-Prymnesium_polylepis.1
MQAGRTWATGVRVRAHRRGRGRTGAGVGTPARAHQRGHITRARARARAHHVDSKDVAAPRRCHVGVADGGRDGEGPRAGRAQRAAPEVEGGAEA